MVDMYASVLFLHSWLRWLVVLFALIALGRAIAGATGRRPWLPADDRAANLFLRTLDLQVLLGLLLYFVLSPITRGALSDFGGAMQVDATRFWAVEHVFGMLAATALAHIGHKRVQRIQDHGRKHRVTAIFFALALIAIMAAIPWPGTVYERPLVRWS
jgi:hypothetical protein